MLPNQPLLTCAREGCFLGSFSIPWLRLPLLHWGLSPDLECISFLRLLEQSTTNQELKTTEIYCLTILDAENLKTACWQANAPGETCETFPTSGGAPVVLACSCSAPISASLSHGILLVSLSIWWSSYRDTGHPELRVHSTSVWLHLN